MELQAPSTFPRGADQLVVMRQRDVGEPPSGEGDGEKWVQDGESLDNTSDV